LTTPVSVSDFHTSQDGDRDGAIEEREERPDLALRVVLQEVRDLEPRGEAAGDLRIVDDQQRRPRARSAMQHIAAALVSYRNTSSVSG
jgi:hypothetical protein